jgi:hypothetical protein
MSQRGITTPFANKNILNLRKRYFSGKRTFKNLREKG